LGWFIIIFLCNFLFYFLTELIEGSKCSQSIIIPKNHYIVRKRENEDFTEKEEQTVGEKISNLIEQKQGKEKMIKEKEEEEREKRIMYEKEKKRKEKEELKKQKKN
jgi:hypothetical protein